jgi:hypothetical protein
MGALTLTDRRQFRATLAQVAARAKERLPECNGRVEKATALVLNGDIEYHPEDGSALVNSCTDPTQVYHVKGGTCDCKDFSRAPGHRCKHIIGVMMVIRVQQVLAAEAPQGQPVEDNGSPLPEAPASCNVRVLVAGHEVQWTLRGHDEADVFTRLQTLLARKDVRPLPPKPAPRAAGQQWKPRRQYQGA